MGAIPMKVTLYTRDRSTRQFHRARNRNYPEGTIFVLRYAGRWETLKALNFTEATVAARSKEIDLLQHGLPKPSPESPRTPANGVSIDEEVNTYLANVLKLAPKTHAAY